jgi:hypothetical protein
MRTLIFALILVGASAGGAAAQCYNLDGCPPTTQAQKDAYYRGMLQNGGGQRALAVQQRHDRRDYLDCRYLGRCR